MNKFGKWCDDCWQIKLNIDEILLHKNRLFTFTIFNLILIVVTAALIEIVLLGAAYLIADIISSNLIN